MFLAQLEGFAKKVQEHLVCRLKKALYGLNQAPSLCYENINSLFLQ